MVGARILELREALQCDGREGLKCYWHDLRSEDLDLSRIEHGGNGVIFSAAFCSYGKTKFGEVHVRLNGT